MALETLKDVKEIGGFKIGRAGGWKDKPDGPLEFLNPIVLNDDTNTIAFTLQNGPIKEVGVNGCQVDTLIEAARLIIQGLNRKFPCIENATAILKLDAALDALSARKKNREARGVEGLDKE